MILNERANTRVTLLLLKQKKHTQSTLNQKCSRYYLVHFIEFGCQFSFVHVNLSENVFYAF